MQSSDPGVIAIRPMQETDLAGARRIFSLAFGTFIGLPEPAKFCADRDFISTRWRNDPEAALMAEVDGRPAGSCLVTNWGSFGFFGPLTVRPDLWGRKVAQKLLERTMEIFAKWGVREAGLYTFSNSPKHIALYQKFGFWPGSLTALMSKAVTPIEFPVTKYSVLDAASREQILDGCRRLTDGIYEGLDVTSEIRAVARQNLGDTVVLWDRDSLDGFAICHCGEETEAGKDTCYIKFAAVRPGAGAEGLFDRLLDACYALAAARGLRRIEAGMNLNRREAYRQLLRRGFRTDTLGVAMHWPDSYAYNRPAVFVIDDWR